MKIAADKNIPFAREVFSTLGEVKLFEPDEITNLNICNFDILLVRSTVKVDENLLDGTKIKFVGSAVAGTDHVDIEYLQKNGIGFSAAAGCNARSVTEYVITAIYAFCQKKQTAPQNLTVGIIGVGHIGCQVAEILKKLKVKILLNDPILEKQGIGNFVPLDYLAENSDIVTIHTPLTESGEYKTRYLLNKKFFDNAKNGMFLIQASRGAVCDENALLKAIGKIENPVIDVWENEPSVNLDLAKNSVFCTPHIAGHSFDGKINGIQIVYKACCAFFFKMPSFDFEEEIFSTFESITIDFEKSIADTMLKCCPVADDNSEFRGLLEITDENKRQSAFNRLRQNYPKRLEFSHYSVRNAPSKTRDELDILGFCTE